MIKQDIKKDVKVESRDKKINDSLLTSFY